MSASTEESKNFNYKLISRANFNEVLFPSELDQEKLPPKCSFCGKIFAYESQVRRHMRIHTGEKPYSCEFCNKTFAQRIEVLKHIRTHTGEKPFKCNLCNYRSAQLCNVKTHMKAKHPDWDKLHKTIPIIKS